MTAVHVIVPEGIDDPARPSGGNTYDRRVCDGLAALGWAVREHAVPGAWPSAGSPGLAALAGAMGAIPDGAVVLLDGLIASAAPEALVPHARRLRQVVLVHMPLGHRPPDDEAAVVRAREHLVLAGAAAIVTTSEWTRRRLGELYALPAERVHVAEPGVDGAALAPGTEAGGALLCVAAVIPGKGHDVLLDALAGVGELPWRCTCVGSLDRDPAFAAAAQRRAGGGVRFAGVLSGAELDREYAAADLLVLASHGETYGMVVTEALSRGLPVLATDAGGVGEALGHGENGARPGLLVPPGDPAALARGAAPLARGRRPPRDLAPRGAGAARDPAPLGRDHGRPRRRPHGRGGPRVGGGAMSAAAVRVSPAWLELREPADAAARSEELVTRLRRHLGPGELVVHDLGGGSGSMGRWLAPRLPGPQRWVVHDRDADLLELALAGAPAGVGVEARRSDVTRLEPADLAGASVVVASALLDLLTADELASMLRACAGRPLLLALTVAGRVELAPAHQLDARIGAAFNAHQRRDGRLGPDAVAAAVARLDGAEVRPSPWRLGPPEACLTAEWLEGWVAAACEQEPALAAAASAYRDLRSAQIAAGELSVAVDHADLLVLP